MKIFLNKKYKTNTNLKLLFYVFTISVNFILCVIFNTLMNKYLYKLYTKQKKIEKDDYDHNYLIVLTIFFFVLSGLLIVFFYIRNIFNLNY